jgi:hypothetical protein
LGAKSFCDDDGDGSGDGGGGKKNFKGWRMNRMGPRKLVGEIAHFEVTSLCGA